ncbi:uncharacterized protein MYCFIDRAFT_90342 [Pseudocercospora fijiensis CIRAD86]|uniref:RING-type E3 ubiquitin transferase n=1 Tax=Pseudocercospora fijiensis (strain CIRAD86) TaxID=383855 RepID=M3B9S2_PSEFD|nr:uncharacterized protein MYCFIDRAFT_90342 [Pseudocercospora fijiensis CIRAD86]EME86077.1 hypothetical protein MYCFIDRAFT_90342 [Pseudocercospora fijiensis CIRAD86]
MDRPQAPPQRELVYCHQCENEWYRDEHGIICPECQSDFTEIIEHNHDPREEIMTGPDFTGFAPDPDEDDIGNFEWRNNGPGQPPGGHYHGTFTRNITLGGGGQPGQGSGGIGGVLSGLIGPALQGLLGGQQQPRQNQQDPRGQDGPRSPASQSGSPAQGEQQRGNGNTFVRHGSGPGYSFTITTSANGNLFPRDANQPQPVHDPQEHLDRMMAQMFMNIGGIMGGPSGFPDILRLFGMPHGGVQGDAVYTQEALDRIITQLMEQHQTGNAPGPATEEAIDALPKRKITAKDQGDSGKADCSICMDEAELGSDVTELPCGHWFHHDCVKAWLKEHDTCPHCRQGIMPRDDANTNRPRQPSQAPMHDMHSPEYQRQNLPERSGGVFSRMREAFTPREQPPSNDGGNRP